MLSPTEGSQHLPKAAVPIPEGMEAIPEQSYSSGRAQSHSSDTAVAAGAAQPILQSFGERQQTYLQVMQASSSVLSQHLEYIAYIYERDACTICVKPSANSLPFLPAAVTAGLYLLCSGSHSMTEQN